LKSFDRLGFLPFAVFAPGQTLPLVILLPFGKVNCTMKDLCVVIVEADAAMLA
jgi:hypothetical protein